jgi:hypothetical protein
VSDVFADTSGWASSLDRSQPFHAQAAAHVQQVQQSSRRLVTTNYVLAELTALLTSPLRVSKPQQIALLSTLRASP